MCIERRKRDQCASSSVKRTPKTRFFWNRWQLRLYYIVQLCRRNFPNHSFSVKEIAMTEEQQQKQMTLEGYKDLSAWNQRDAQTVVSFDKIFLPATIGAWAVSLTKYPRFFIYVYIGSWLLLTFWIFLSWRYRERITERFCIMKNIECCLDFKAHTQISKTLTPPRDITLRWCFYVITLLLGVLVAIINPDERETIVASYVTWIVVLPLVLTVLFALVCKWRKKVAGKMSESG